MAYAILRTAKLTSFGNIASSAMHNFRERKTLNADETKTKLNKTSGAQNSREVLQQVKARLATVPNVRKNAVLTIEYFIGMSPEYSGDINGYFQAAKDWLIAKHGVENVISVTQHYDETTPHICAYVVPIDPRGRLNAAYYLDGRVKLSEMQTDFAEKCGKPFSLVRGIEGSTAKHQTLKKYYAKIQAQTPEVTTKLPPEPEPPTFLERMAEAIGLETEHNKAVIARLEAKKTALEQAKTKRKIEQAKARQYDTEKAANKAREAQLTELRATATQAREIPLQLVLERLGATIDPKDKKQFKTHCGRISINGSQFYNHDTSVGGGGAIDLVMQLNETNYTSAVNWLAKEFSASAVIAEKLVKMKEEVETIAKQNLTLDPLKPHAEYEKNWQKTRSYLTEKRGISASFIDNLHEKGYIYADKFNNAVFVLSQKKGLYLRGTSDKPFHGVRGEKTPFILGAKNKASKKVAFVESPIDALSLRDLGFEGRIIATMGNAAEHCKLYAAEYRSIGLEIVGAFDNDTAGENMCKALGVHTRMKPGLKDWNEDLIAKKATTNKPTIQHQHQQEHQLKQRKFVPGR